MFALHGIRTRERQQPNSYDNTIELPSRLKCSVDKFNIRRRIKVYIRTVERRKHRVIIILERWQGGAFVWNWLHNEETGILRAKQIAKILIESQTINAWLS